MEPIITVLSVYIYKKQDLQSTSSSFRSSKHGPHFHTSNIMGTVITACWMGDMTEPYTHTEFQYRYLESVIRERWSDYLIQFELTVMMIWQGGG